MVNYEEARFEMSTGVPDDDDFLTMMLKGRLQCLFGKVIPIIIHLNFC
ncbi:hypothetical protein FHR92_004450 [Fontibacillus solani]|uniref:Uncharacterized protein n=1 Tax=Fontibacillus solani TaxID=1572857 RepID=A0A7W3SXC3_9BACL|nr:hypothetical protein [Fontibacillus solani]